MKVNDITQLLEISKSVVIIIPMAGTQLSAAIDVTIMVCKLVAVWTLLFLLHTTPSNSSVGGPN